MTLQEEMGDERPRKKEKRYLPSKSRPHRSILLLLVLNSVYNRYSCIGAFFVFIEFLNV